MRFLLPLLCITPVVMEALPVEPVIVKRLLWGVDVFYKHINAAAEPLWVVKSIIVQTIHRR